MTNVRWLAVPLMCALVTACSPQAPEPTPTSSQAYTTLDRMMQGVAFPNANIIYDAQAVNPETGGQAAHDTSAGATALYSSVYGGWTAVENAALAVAETANLLMVPGRLCKNGAPVPVENEDFQRWARELGTAGLEAYKAAQSKDQDEIIFVSDTLTQACGNCHERYRDTEQEADRCK